MQVLHGFPACAARISFLLLFLGGCSALKKSADPQFPPLTKPLNEEQRAALIDEVGRNWLYGEGIGDTVLSVGAVLAFPPYIVALVGNGALAVAGYEPLSIAQILPNEVRDGYVAGRDAVVSAPGQVAAAAAGEEFRTQSMAKHAIKSAMLAPNEEVKFR